MISEKQELVVDGLFLFNQSKRHLNYPLHELNNWLIYPIIQDKIRVFYDDAGKPISLVTWCWLTKEQGIAFDADDYVPTEEDYARDTGDELWGIQFIAPKGHTIKTMRAMRELTAALYPHVETVRWIRLDGRSCKGKF